MKYNINWEENLPKLIHEWGPLHTDPPLHLTTTPDIFSGENNILTDSELIFKWPPVSSEIDPGSITHPNTDVLVERGKKVCSAFFGESFTFGDSKYTDENTRTNFINDWDGNLTSIYTSNDVQKWSDASVKSTNFSLITKDIDFGQPSQRKKIYKVYVTYTGGTSQNINVTYRTNGGNGSWLEFDGDLDSTTVAQVEAELKPNASINNIKSLQLKFDGTSAATFEINDISIVYRLKPAR